MPLLNVTFVKILSATKFLCSVKNLSRNVELIGNIPVHSYGSRTFVDPPIMSRVKLLLLQTWPAAFLAQQ